MGENEVIEVPSSPENQGSRVRDIVCLKEEFYMREIEEIKDCFILDFKPNDSIDLSKLSMSKDLHNPVAPGIYVLAEHDQVACRDYPHSRHLCSKKRFERRPLTKSTVNCAIVLSATRLPPAQTSLEFQGIAMLLAGMNGSL